MRRRPMLALIAIVTLVVSAAVVPAHAGATSAPTGWSALTRVEAPVGGVLSISCATTTHCVAVDHGGNVVTFNGSTWGAPAQITTSAALISLSCPTVTRCVALDAAGNALIMTGTTWSAPRNVFGAEFPRAISCADATDCMAIGASGDAFAFTATHWNPAVQIDPGQSLTAISCPDAANCVAVDAVGNVITQSAGVWSIPSAIDTSTTGLVAISCPGVGSCTAIDGAGYAFRSSAGVFDAGTLITHPNGAMTAISCPTTSTCVATDDAGDFATFSGTGWSAPVGWGQGGMYTVSCAPGSDSCVAATYGDDGLALTIINNAVSSSLLIDERNDLTGVACVGTAPCVAIDRAGSTLVANGTGWSLPVHYGLDPSPLIAIACPSATRCIELGTDGTLTTLTGAGSLPSATSVLADASATPVALSCPSATLCMIADAAGRVISVVAGTPQAPVALGLAGTPTAMSCPAVGSCVVTDSKGNVATLAGGHWTRQAVDSPATTGLVAISCATPAFCVAVDGDGYAAIRTSTGWLANAISADQAGGLTSVSCPVVGYCVAVDKFLNVVTYANGSWSSPLGLSGVKVAATSAFISCGSSTTCTVVDGMDQSASYVAAPTNPVLRAITPSVLGQGAPLTLAFASGIRLDKNAVLSASKKGITFAKATILGTTQLRTAVGVASTVAPGPVDVVVTDYPRGTAICHACLVITAAPVLTSASAHEVRRGATGDMVAFHGSGFVAGTVISTTNAGVTFKVLAHSATTLTCAIAVTKTAAVAPVTLTVTNPDHGTTVRSGLLSVTR